MTLYGLKAVNGEFLLGQAYQNRKGIYLFESLIEAEEFIKRKNLLCNEIIEIDDIQELFNQLKELNMCYLLIKENIIYLYELK